MSSRNLLTALTAVNTVGLLVVGGALVLRSEPEPRPSGDPAEPARLAELEARLARLEGATGLQPPTPGATAAPSAAPAASAAAAQPGQPGVASPAAPDAPVTRGQVEALVQEQLARREARYAEAAKAAQPAARPKRPLSEVARDLGLDARQESTTRDLLRQLERDSMKVLFEVDDVGLEQLKGELAQAERDPRLKEQLRERLSINWTRRQAEIGVLWIKLDARLRETLGVELQKKFYGFDVQLEPREFPDIQQMFFAPPPAEADQR